MATRARHAEKVEFHDGTDMTLRPLTIKNLRIFMDKLDEVRKELNKDTEDGEGPELDELGLLGNFIELALFCVNSQRDEEMAEEAFEDIADMPTVQDIMRICAGVELGNPTATTATSPLGRR